MPMGRVLGIVALVGGAILLYFGLNASDAPMEQLNETLTGSYSDRTMWYLVGGAAAACGGVVLLLLGRKA
jgi:threonine/homoserine/homoserine lactone efflux protein